MATKNLSCCIEMNTVYLFKFDMLSPMLSRRNVPQSFLVSNEMVKVGITRDFERRFSDYKNTYCCERCSKPHVNLIKKWPVNLGREDCEKIEKTLKREFISSSVRGEYYEKIIVGKLEERLDELVKGNSSKADQTKKTAEIRGISMTAKQQGKRNTRSLFEGKIFLRTSKEISPRCARHNIKRWQWIAKAGKTGKTFDQINRRNSVYRHCIKRKSYNGNSSSINQDLKYDIKNGWITIKH